MSHKFNSIFHKNTKQGFTLVEILVALAISSVVISGVIYSYIGQQKSELSQTQLVEMQQSIRAAMYMLAHDIRMTGYDRHRAFSAGITNAGDGSNGCPLTLTYVEGDTDTNPGSLTTLSYVLEDASGDGDLDIVRIDHNDPTPTTPQDFEEITIAENIQNLVFTYLDGNGAELPITSCSLNPSDIPSIRAIRIDMTARLDARFDKNVHNPQGAVRSVSTIVKCRNLGL
jgi:type IV pilus assembly protein PilW